MGNLSTKKRHIDPDTVISVIAPVYNEVDIIDNFVGEIRDVLAKLDFPGRCEMLFVDDGSTDGSGEKLDEWATRHPEEIVVIHMTRNFGHEAAVGAGMKHARGDVVILMDSDLQDDPAAFSEFLDKWKQGYDVVYATRKSRQESLLYRIMFNSFYRLLGWMADFKLPRNAGNFSLMDRRVVDRINALDERNRYLPGLRAWVGFRQTGIEVDRRKRHDKSPRVGFRAKWTLAMNAIFSFSYVPIFMFRVIGLAAILLSIVLFLLTVVQNLSTGAGIDIWSYPVVWIAFFAGINLFGISVVGEYVARIYDEVKGRPKFIIDRIEDGRASDE